MLVAFVALTLAAPTHLDVDLPREGKAALPVRIDFDPDLPGPHPVIVWSHGLFGSREGYEPLVKAWVAAGYVVVRPTHDDSLALRGAREKVEHLRSPDLSSWTQRPVDVRHALDALPGIEGLPMLDLEHVGMGGHSFGAQTAQLVAGVRSTAGDSSGRPAEAGLAGGSPPDPDAEFPRKSSRRVPDGSKLPSVRDLPYVGNLSDPRPDAFLWISPQGDGLLFDRTSYPLEHRPVLMMTGSRDLQPGSEKGAEWRMTAWTALSAPATLLFVDDGEHAFGGISGHVRRGQKADPALVSWVAQATTEWWNAQLRQQPAPWLEPGQAEARTGGRLHVTTKP